jgi:hypothetical protein
MSRIKEKISSLVASQVPEFVRSDYTTFVDFLETYYRFLEQDQGAQELIQNAASYADIDRTAESFVQYFLKTYANNIPQNILANKRLLVKRIKDLYESKGSELSYKLLFKILYDSTVSIKHPYDTVLRPSDGTWDQRVSVRVRIVSGNPLDLTDRYLDLSKNGVIYKNPIIRAKILTGGVYELFLKPVKIPPYEIGDTVTVSSKDGVVFTGTIDPTTTDISILRAGSGFKRGQIFTVNIAGAVDTIVKITAVTASGGVDKFKIINFGYNFTENVTVNLYRDLTVVARTTDFETKTNPATDSGTIIGILTITNPDRYFDTNYVEAIGLYNGYSIKTFSDTPSGSGSTTGGDQTLEAGDQTAAILTFKLGAVARYTGQYTTNKGFPSEPDVRLQDGGLYQPFAYQLVTQLNIDTFYDVLTKLVHPAGMSMYNERVIYSSADLNANVSISTLSATLLSFIDNFTPGDSDVFTMNKPVNDLTDNSTDVEVYTLYKPVSEETNLNDSETYNLNKVVTDATSIPADTNTISLAQGLADIQTVIESTSTLLNRSINNTDSTVSLTDTLEYTILDYAEAGYFAETYAGTTTIIS